MGLVVYMSHPIGDGGLADQEKRADNIANAGEWVRFFVDTTRWVILCPWYLYAITHGEEIYGPRRLVDQLSALERCDLLVLTGGVISPHMSYEVSQAKRYGIPVVDVTTFGVSPPRTSSPSAGTQPYRDAVDEETVQLILARVQRAMKRLPRRVWMPMLSEDDIARLQESRHALYVHMPDEHNKAVALLDRIIAAALDYGTD
jgi:hypothetical protein